MLGYYSTKWCNHACTVPNDQSFPNFSEFYSVPVNNHRCFPETVELLGVQVWSADSNTNRPYKSHNCSHAVFFLSSIATCIIYDIDFHQALKVMCYMNAALKLVYGEFVFLLLPAAIIITMYDHYWGSGRESSHVVPADLIYLSHTECLYCLENWGKKPLRGL